MLGYDTYNLRRNTLRKLFDLNDNNLFDVTHRQTERERREMGEAFKLRYLNLQTNNLTL